MSGTRLREESFSLRLFGSEKVRLLSWNVGTSPRQLHVCTETAVVQWHLQGLKRLMGAMTKQF